MVAGDGQAAAALKQRWSEALQALQAIPAAATDSDRSQQLAAAAVEACEHALKLTAAEDLQGQSPECRKVLVDDLQIPLHLAKAVATLISIPSTAPQAADLSQHLTTLLAALEPFLAELRNTGDQTLRYTQPGSSLAIATQLQSSGLVKQLPAALKQAQQQLEKAHVCSQGTAGGVRPVQAHLLALCTQLVSFWPRGALESKVLGPCLTPVADLALASLQYVTQQAGCCSSSCSSGSSGSSGSSTPCAGLAALGQAALSTCVVLCGSASVLMYSSPDLWEQGSTQMPEQATGLLCSPAMISAIVAAVMAALYGELVGANATAAGGCRGREGGSGAGAAVAAASSSNSPADAVGNGSQAVDLQALEPLTAVQQAPQQQQPQQLADGSAADMSAAAWQYLSAREGCLQPDQPLLPPLQQQLCELLGCSSKGFLWLAAVWAGQSDRGLVEDLPVEVFLQIALQVHFMIEAARGAAAAAKGAGSKHPIQPQMLQQLRLMPATMLRLALHKQQQLSSPSTAAAGAPSWAPMLAARVGMESLMLWTRLSEYAVLGQRHGAKADAFSGQAVGHIPEGVLRETLQLLVQLLHSTLHQAQPGTSSSGGSGGSGAGGLSTEWLFPDGSVFDCCTPAVTAATLTGYIGYLTPNVTEALAAAGPAAASAASKPRSSDWVLLLLRVAAVLQHSIRFEAQQGPSQPQMDHRWQPLYRDMPQGPPWFAAFCLLSTALHKSVDVYTPSPDGPPNAMRELLQPRKPASKAGGQHSLLRWLLDNAVPEQQGAVQQQVLGLLSTALKLSGKPRSYSELNNVANFHKGALEVIWAVLQQLQDSAGTSSRSSSTCAEGSPAAAASSSSSSSMQDAGGAYLQWLSLLGRVLLQAAEVISGAREHLRTVLSAQQVAGADKEELVSTVINAMRLADGILPTSISYTAVLFAADAAKQLPANRPHQGLMGQILAPDQVKLTGQKKRELQRLGQQVASYCSNAGIGLAKLQDSSWALADAHAAVATFLFQSIGSFGMTTKTSFPGNAPVAGDMQPYFFQEWGIPPSLAQKTAQSCFKGQGCDMQDLLLTAFVVHPNLSTYLKQLEGLGLALSGFPIGRSCSNPRCGTLAGGNEEEAVGGASCRCSGCRLVWYCNREVCQKGHWGVHKAVCKGVQAAAAAAGAAKVGAA